MSKYWPVFVTTIENTVIHFITLLMTIICCIKDNCCLKEPVEDKEKEIKPRLSIKIVEDP
jgi:hypothetical protein